MCSGKSDKHLAPAGKQQTDRDKEISPDILTDIKKAFNIKKSVNLKAYLVEKKSL